MFESPSNTPLEFARKILRSWDIINGPDGNTTMKEQMKRCNRAYLFVGRDANGRSIWIPAEDRKEEEIDALVEKARQDPVAFKAARELAMDDLQNDQLPPEPSLKKFAIDCLGERIIKPPKRGQTGYEKTRKYRCFAYICFHLQKEFGCNIYRNTQSSPRNLTNCACDIVAEAARLEGIDDITYETVRTAWTRSPFSTSK